MAMIDYGCVVKCNGKIINQDQQFCNMNKCLGFAIEKTIEGNNIDGDYFAFAGDEKYFIGFYKTSAVLFIQSDKGYTQKHIDIKNEQSYRCYDLESGYEYSYYFLRDNSIVYLTLNTPNTQWEVLFGYGIDTNYKTQLECAFDYGLSVSNIEQIAKFWGHIIYVNGLKCKLNHKNKVLNRKYVYKEMKGYYALGVIFEDDVTGGRMAQEWYYKQKELPQLMNDLSDLPVELKNLIAKISLTESSVLLYATYYHPIINTNMCSTYNGTKITDTRFYNRIYTRKEIKEWRF